MAGMAVPANKAIAATAASCAARLEMGRDVMLMMDTLLFQK
jgi:hypothetical protein